MKHFYCAGDTGTADYAPRFYFEARIDYSDLRTGFHHTSSVSETVRFLPLQGDELWMPDMLMHVDPEGVQPEAPPGAKLRPLPAFVTEELLQRFETLVCQYLMRCAGIRLFRNPEVNLCSAQGEHADDFRRRCLEKVKDPFRREMDRQCEIAVRRLEQLKNKYLDETVPDECDAAGIALRNRDLLRQASDRVTEIYLRTDVLADAPLPAGGSPGNELEERLEALEGEVCRQVRDLLLQYREKAGRVDDYFVRANHKDIHLVRAGILWLPAAGDDR